MIRIMVSGRTASGKSTIMAVILKMLLDEGVRAVVDGAEQYEIAENITEIDFVEVRGQAVVLTEHNIAAPART